MISSVFFDPPHDTKIDWVNPETFFRFPKFVFQNFWMKFRTTSNGRKNLWFSSSIDVLITFNPFSCRFSTRNWSFLARNDRPIYILDDMNYSDFRQTIFRNQDQVWLSDICPVRVFNVLEFKWSNLVSDNLFSTIGKIVTHPTFNRSQFKMNQKIIFWKLNFRIFENWPENV